MSDELKDFRYYADKAEWLLSGDEFDGRPLAHQTVLVEMAHVYAELAKAVPEHAPNPHYVIMTEAEAEMFRAMKGDQ
jgi:hypothetical protein